MVLNTVTVSTAVAPTVIQTYISHYINRKPLRQKPTAHISYHEGVQLIRRFLIYASHHTVEELQAFTSQWVPSPTWVKVESVTIPEKVLSEAASALIAQLGHKGIDKVGGETWWQWRQSGKLQAEWIEMKRDYTRRKQSGTKGNRVMLYVHGGAYFFGSVDEHRYQMQRHARKLEARVFAPRYRLAPQYPFPCGLHDCLAAYLYLLAEHSANEVVLAGDSAGAGMLVSVLVILRDQGLPLPAGAILISPWVDLSHSFPSVAGDGRNDYIPAYGFMQRPSASWPPPTAADMEQITKSAIKSAVDETLPRKSTQQTRHKAEDEALKDFRVNVGMEGAADNDAGVSRELVVELDGKEVVIRDQIQMYTTNQLISHPLVSPILQPSLGGLPPLLIMTGGGEVLRDEQIYLAHKAANPAAYPPSAAYLADHGGEAAVSKWKPTDVHLQVWDDLCHVAPTLSFTRPAKFMYRSIAQFGAWVLAKAQSTGIEIQDDDDVSIISSGSESDLEKPNATPKGTRKAEDSTATRIGRAGDPLPSFKHHMIRQRVDRNGDVFPLGPASSLPALQLAPAQIGVPKAGPLRKWLDAKAEWDNKYAREKRRMQKQRAIEMAQGYQGFGNDEVPPPSALAGRRGVNMPEEEKKSRSWGMSLWSLWGSTHDEDTMKREARADTDVSTTTIVNEQGGDDAKVQPMSPHNLSRPKSRRRTVTYSGEDAPTAKKEHAEGVPQIAVPTINAETGMPNPQTRPSAGGQAFPFKLKPQLAFEHMNASTITLMSEKVNTPKLEEDRQLGSAGPSEVKDDEGGLKAVSKEDRRETMQDSQGILHKGLPPSSAEQTADEPPNELPPAHPAQLTAMKGTQHSEPVPTDTRRETMEDKQGILHKGLPRAAEQKTEEPPDELPPAQPTQLTAAKDEHATAVPAEARRETIEDRDGVLHKGLPTTTKANGGVGGGSVGVAAPPAKAESTTLEEQQDESDAEDSDDTTRGIAPAERRETMPDKDGVLHIGTVVEKKKAERPTVERFETAREEV